MHEINQDHQEFLRQVLVNTLVHARSKISKFFLQESFQDCNFDASFFCSFFYMFQISQVPGMIIICCFVCNFLTTLRLFLIKIDFLLSFFFISRNLRERKTKKTNHKYDKIYIKKTLELLVIIKIKEI